jgi:hypothetical protein
MKRLPTQGVFVSTRTSFILVLALVAGSNRARADDAADQQLATAEFLDVIESSDGTIWTGVITEQTPNVQYKLVTSDGTIRTIKAVEIVRMTKRRNPHHLATAADTHDARPASVAVIEPISATAHDDISSPSTSLIPHSGLRIDPEFALVFPMSDLSDNGTSTSFGVGVRVGYEWVAGKLGFATGFQGRFTWFSMASADNTDVQNNIGDSAWLLETHLYARLAYHLNRFAPYAGVSLGLDTTNVGMSASGGDASTQFGFGMNVQAGLQVAATRAIAFDLGADFHPGTDTLGDQGNSAS